MKSKGEKRRRREKQKNQKEDIIKEEKGGGGKRKITCTGESLPKRRNKRWWRDYCDQQRGLLWEEKKG